MRIAILGSGAMGMLFGGYLSVYNEVYMVLESEKFLVNKKDKILEWSGKIK